MSLLRISQQYGVGKSSAWKAIRDCTRAIVLELGQKLICLPSTREQCLALMQGFHRRSGFPNVIGAIDGVHFEIRNPPGCITRDYFDRNKDFSVSFQCVVDYRGNFTSVVGPWPGSVHDSRILKNSDLWSMGEAGQWNIDGLDCVFLADSGYPLRPWLITPFTERQAGGVQQDQAAFNTKLSRTRIIVEQAFGRL
jgi:hypothetical protein